MNKRIFITFVFSAVLFSCVNQNVEQNKPSVVVSILPQKYFVERIADTLLRVEVMVPPGSSPETYEPTPSQLIAFSKAKIYFSLGLLDFEKTTLRKITEQNPNVKAVVHSASLSLIEGGHNHLHDGHAHNHGYDPHVWTSPLEVKAIVGDMVAALSEVFPEHAKTFEANANLFIIDIESLNMHIKKVFEGYEGAKFFIFHPALSYFARDYDLVQVSFEEEGKSPSAKHLKNVMKQSNAEGIRTIFIQKEFDINIAKTAAADIGGEVVVINPLEADWLSNMYSITEQIKKAIEK
ncbi:MAG: zinc ABC transporter substrate-binding protein [Tenuifilaceae bacterium]|jgi:zinc transport system substrate-binding protein|nr:zinc ABC transporter substrate-binding protein [Tenuifilaceae bacterium]